MEPRATIDVSELPHLTFGHKNLAWWATLSFMVIEGFSLLVAATVYLYLRKNFTTWPPAPTPLPDVLIPTVNAALLLGAIGVMVLADRAAHRRDLRGCVRWLAVEIVLAMVILALRVGEFEALNTRWDDHAYGSAAWLLLVLHSTLLLLEFLESAAFLAILKIGPVEEKYFSDVSDAAFYQYFLSLSNLVVYALLFLSPRWI